MDRQQKPLRAFVTGYSAHKFSLEELTSELTSRYPFISRVFMPQKAFHWKGFAFVDFETRPEFLTFIRQKRVRVERFEMNLVIKAYKEGKVLQKFVKDVNKRKVCIKGIPRDWDDLKLEEAFLRFGKVENAYVERRLGQQEELLKGMVIFCAKRCAVECSSLQEMEVGHKVKLQLELFIRRKEAALTKQRTNGNESKEDAGQGFRIPLKNTHVDSFRNGGKKGMALASHDHSPRAKEWVRKPDEVRPTSGKYFKNGAENFQNHSEFQGNIRLNFARRRKISRIGHYGF